MNNVGLKPPDRSFSKSLTGLVLGAVVPIFIFGAITASTIVSQKEAALTRDLASTAAALSVAVDLELLSQFKTMNVLASSSLTENQTDDLRHFNQLARWALQANSQWSNIGLIDADSARILAGAPALPSGTTYSLSPQHVAQVVASRKPSIVGTFNKGRLSDGPVVILMVPVMRGDKVRYVLGVAMRPQALSDIFAAQGMSHQWTGATVDEHMILSGRSRDADKYVGALVTPSLQTHLRASTAGLFSSSTKDGLTAYTVFHRSARTGWSVVIGVPTAELDAPLHQLLLQLAAAALGLTLLALAAAVYVGRNIISTRNSYEQALHQGQQALQEALHRLTQIAANLPGVVFQFRRQTDGSFQVPYASDAVKEVLNATADEVCAAPQKVFDLVHPADLQALQESIERSATNLSPWKHEYRVQWRDGSLHWLFGNALPQAEADGGVLWHGFITDISAHKNMEKAAQENEMKFQLILESAPDAIFIVDPQGNYRYVNTAACHLLGFTREEMLQKHIVDITPENEVALSLHLLKRLQSGELVQTELHLVHREQTLVPVAFYGVQLPDGYIYGSCRDISDRIKVQKELQNSREELEDLYENAPCGYHSVDREGLFQRINQTELNWLGYSREEVVGKMHLSDVLTERSRQVLQTHFAEFLKAGAIGDMELDFQRKNGSMFHGLVSATSILDAQGNFLSSRSTLFDLTDRVHSEEQIRIAEERFRLFFEKNSSVMLLIDSAHGKIVNANQAAASYYGYSLECLLGMPIAHINTMTRENIQAEMQCAADESRNFFLFQHRLESGELRDVEVYSTPIETRDGTLLLSIVHDITLRTLSERKVHQLAFYDALTQLPNRTLLHDRLSQAMNNSKRSHRYCALMFIDLDNFKPINDLHGHSAGDLLLVEVARRIRRCLRETDTVARFGGDEFVVLLNELDEELSTSVDRAKNVAEKIRHTMAETYTVAVHEADRPENFIHHHCTASIGLAVFSGTEFSQDELQQQADAAMYQAKGLGRNQVCLAA